MSDWLAQIVLARRGPDDDGWMNLLFVIVMAVIWIIGAVVKAMKTRSEHQPPRQQPARDPKPHRPPASGTGRQQPTPDRVRQPARPAQPFGTPRKRTTLADLREAARRFAAEAEKAFQTQTDKPAAAAPRPAPKPPATSKPPMLPEPSRQIDQVIAPIKGLDDKQSTAAQSPANRRLPDILTDYADPEKLRKAIIHYEILGPPLSLRD